MHGRQTRADGQTPYIIHPMGVVKILWKEGGIQDPAILHAALLHDTLEDTEATPRDIQFIAGASILSIVNELTHAPITQFKTASLSAKIIKLADRIYNLRDLTNGNFPKKEIDDYYNSSRELLEAVKGSHPVLEELLHNQILQGLMLK
jgi:guanosine-3',5'-bis(diphosphate) 3'-pyrophosphohydrolase